MGVRVLQIADNSPLHQLPPDELETFSRRASELGIAIEVGTRGIARELLLAYLCLAERLDSAFVRTVVDTADHQPSEDEIVGAIREIIPNLEQAGVALAIENHDRFKAKTLARIIERIGSASVGICLDTTNSLGASEGPEAVVETLGPLTINVHVKDYVIYRPDHKMGFTVEGRPAGQGQLDIPWLLDKLHGYGINPNIILELWTPPEETLPATIAKEQSWATASVEYMRRFVIE